MWLCRGSANRADLRAPQAVHNAPDNEFTIQCVCGGLLLFTGHFSRKCGAETARELYRPNAHAFVRP